MGVFVFVGVGVEVKNGLGHCTRKLHVVGSLYVIVS